MCNVGISHLEQFEPAQEICYYYVAILVNLIEFVQSMDLKNLAGSGFGEVTARSAAKSTMTNECVAESSQVKPPKRGFQF